MNGINHLQLGIELYYWAYCNICVRVIRHLFSCLHGRVHYQGLPLGYVMNFQIVVSTLPPMYDHVK